MQVIDHDNKEYRIRWNHSGKNKYNGAFYYSKEIVKNIIPRVNTDRNWVLVNCEGQAFDHSIVFIHNNVHPERYNWLEQYEDLILVCGIPQTVPLVEHLGAAIYLPLSIDLEYVSQFRLDKKTKDVAFVGRPSKRNGIKFPDHIDFLEGLPRTKLLPELAKYKEVYAVGRCAVEARALGCDILPYDPRFPDPSIWQVLDNRDAADMLNKQIKNIEKEKGINTVYPTKEKKETPPPVKITNWGKKPARKKEEKKEEKKKERPAPIIIDHTYPEYVAARNKIGKNRYNGAYYYSKEIVERIIPLVNTDRNWITIRAGERAVDHSIVFVHNNRNFEGPYSYLKDYEDIVYVVGLPDMVEQASKLGKTIYLPLSVDVEYVKQFKVKRKSKGAAFVGRRETRRDWEFPEGTDFVEMLPREELLAEMAKYKEVYAIGRTAIEASILGCKILPFHPRLPDPKLWQILDNVEAAQILQEKLDIIDGGKHIEVPSTDKIIVHTPKGMYAIDNDLAESYGIPL